MERYHFIGIGGIGMSALASILLDKGCTVTGSDLALNERTLYLKNRGAKIFEGHENTVVDEDSVVVIHSRIPQDHPELIKAKNSIHRLDLFTKTAAPTPIIAVVGAHGKTSTSALLAHVLSSFDSSIGFKVGGVSKLSGLNGKAGTSKYVLEGDESDGSFLRIHPEGAILTNVDADHLDFWGCFSSLKKGYKDFLKTVRKSELLFFAASEDEGIVQKGTSYGIEKGDIQAWRLRIHEDGSIFDIVEPSKNLLVKDVYLPLMGEHQVKNALGVFGMAKALGIDPDFIKESFRTYLGVKRRCERGKDFYQRKTFLDYGHHPKELQATFQAIKNQYKIPLRVVFEPHKFTRTKNFFQEFVEVLKIPDEVFLLETYSANEDYDYEGSSEKLAQVLNIEVTKKGDLKKVLESRKHTEGAFLFIGAGNIDRVFEECL
ncbi:MAG: UDP-N-acetylmuramate--L-alanine ligase [Chlamydiae bacterium]|nr:UDP-N-acetylmuramate--L-alanine ligase [Chlamydiota bacterium]